MVLTFVSLLFLGLLSPAIASALSLEAIGNFTSPTYVTSDPGNPDRLFVVERGGRIQLVENGGSSLFLDIESIVLSPPDEGALGDHGLYSMAFSPDYATNHLFYVAYSGVDDPATPGEDESGQWHLAEFRADGDSADPASRREVLTIEYPAAQLHYGGQLQFGPDGYLYASTGDGGPQGDPDGNAQNLETLYGKILRIDPQGSISGEYSVPTDNPFAGSTPGEDEIWSYGLRNPWRFSFDRLTGDLVIGDVGSTAWEEVDFAAGPNPGMAENFGWNCREGAHSGPGESSNVCVDRAGTFTEPVFEFPHDGACSITGGYVVRDLSLGELYGRYLYADFCSGEVRSLNLGLPAASGDRSEGLLVPLATSFGEDADGRIYVTSLLGPVYRLTEPPSSEPTPDSPSSEPAPTPGEPGTGPLTLDLEANRQALRKKVKFFATASADSTMVARGKAIKKKTKELAASQRTKIEAKLKRAKRKRLEEKLEKFGRVNVKVKGAATTQSGAEVFDTVKVKLRD